MRNFFLFIALLFVSVNAHTQTTDCENLSRHEYDETNDDTRKECLIQMLEHWIEATEISLLSEYIDSDQRADIDARIFENDSAYNIANLVRYHELLERLQDEPDNSDGGNSENDESSNNNNQVAPILTIEASGRYVDYGDTVTISWTSSGVSSVRVFSAANGVEQESISTRSEGRQMFARPSSGSSRQFIIEGFNSEGTRVARETVTVNWL